MRETKYFIDTNIFLRVIVKDDLRKARDCESFIIKVESGKFKAITSSIVLAEVVCTALSCYKIEKQQIVKILSGILGIKNLKIEDKYKPLDAVLKYAHHNVKFIDCLIASHPRLASKKIKVVSYDKDFDSLGAKRLEPSEII